ncbi:hypothetical protein [Nostoc sp. PCC 9305]|uniref:hypothetical protein n=1 Tax=Nostoc sp. PCC 9305 TaxID=296636 RepID=UPI0039C6D360
MNHDSAEIGKEQTKKSYNEYQINSKQYPIITSKTELNKFLKNPKKDKHQKKIVEIIVTNSDKIIENAIQSFEIKKQDEISVFKPTMKLIFEIITLTIVTENYELLHEVDKLKSKYKTINTESVKSFFTAIKKSIVKTLAIQEPPKYLTISEIKKEYPNQWITIKVTQFLNSFPSKGQVLFYDKDLDKLIANISQLSGDIYTFFTGVINNESEKIIIENDDKDNVYLTILLCYFDRVLELIENEKLKQV